MSLSYQMKGSVLFVETQELSTDIMFMPEVIENGQKNMDAGAIFVQIITICLTMECISTNH